jgi:N-acetylmuramoyl-L-alanine amidase CwlA
MAAVERWEKFEDWSHKVRLCEQRYERKTSLALARAAYRAAKGEPRPRSGRSRPSKPSKVKAGKAKAGAGAGVVRGGAGSRRVAARRPG